MRITLSDAAEGVEVTVSVSISQAARSRVAGWTEDPVAIFGTPYEVEAAARRQLSPAMRRGLDAARLEVLESLARFACAQSEKLNRVASVHPIPTTPEPAQEVASA